MNEQFLRKRSTEIIDNRDENKIDKMTTDIKRILNLSFMQTTSSFDTNNSIELISEYMKNHDRLLYSVISNYIFLLEDEKVGIFITNLDSLAEFVLSAKYNDIYLADKTKRSKVKHYTKIKKTILKLWDHSHLALYQFESLKQSDDEFKRNFIKNISPVKTDVNKQLNEFTKGMNSQLISLVGIFTAMSFLVFGSINSLDGIFKNAQSIPILQIMIIGTVWGLCVTNLVFVFMFFISKMTEMKIKSDLNEDATLIQKYPLIFWSNLILLTVLSMCSWLYYIDTQNIGGWFVNVGKNNSIVVCLIGFLVILISFFICYMYLLGICNKDKCKKSHKNNKKEELQEDKNELNPKSIVS
ncbi:hypothetical protein SR42_15110 [Clostridium botulinum]|uniref:hypothetical protein n=1 Tax=Clostridium botulinum TaxID=1491 RepID=UPI0005972885|nr:hypothetical protein [Clostridium botulinum]KIL06899.1 hypothetical protein SR42_15110 [Clostridium botulinum]MBY6935307.1 hypothetical protein [Clostridium botulinum]NFL82060.1 hypothetical protein [Clostridium botulinum]NFN13186.1 hypothetical protein [Clostridium botulinum]NFO38205.1 hypothetical protein [Clostridium botulinum]